MNYWTKSEDKHLLKNQDTMSNFELGRKFGRSLGAVRSRLSKLRKEQRIKMFKGIKGEL